MLVTQMPKGADTERDGEPERDRAREEEGQQRDVCRHAERKREERHARSHDRDLAGDRVANGTYIYVLRVRRGAQTIDIKGKSVKLE